MSWQQKALVVYLVVQILMLAARAGKPRPVYTPAATVVGVLEMMALLALVVTA